MIVVDEYSVQCHSWQFSNGQLSCTCIWNWNPFSNWSSVYHFDHFVIRWHEQKGVWCEMNKFYEYDKLLRECSLEKLAIVYYLYYWHICNLMVRRIFSLYIIWNNKWNLSYIFASKILQQIKTLPPHWKNIRLSFQCLL